MDKVDLEDTRDVAVAMVIRIPVARTGAMTSRITIARKGRTKIRSPIAATITRATQGVAIGEATITGIPTMKAETVPTTLATGITTPETLEEMESGTEMVRMGTMTKGTESGTEMGGMGIMTSQTTILKTIPMRTKTMSMALPTYPAHGTQRRTATMAMIITVVPPMIPVIVAGTSRQHLPAGPLTMAIPAMIMAGEETTPTPTMTIVATGVIPMATTGATTPAITPITNPETSRIKKTTPKAKTITPATSPATLPPTTKTTTIPATNPATPQVTGTTKPGTQQRKQRSVAAVGTIVTPGLPAVEGIMRGTAEEAGTIATTLAIARMNVVGVVTTRMGTITPIGAGTGITVGIVM